MPARSDSSEQPATAPAGGAIDTAAAPRRIGYLADVSVSPPPKPPPDSAWTALEATSDGVAIFDRDRTIIYVNPAGAAVLDRRVDELLGANMWQAFPEAVDTIFHSSLLRAAETGETMSWRGYYGPVHGWFHDLAVRVGDDVVVVYTRSDEPREAEATRQRLAAAVRSGLSSSEQLLTASEAFTGASSLEEIAEVVAHLVSGDLAPAYSDLALLEPDGRHLRRLRPETIPADVRELYRRIEVASDQPPAQVVRTGRALFVEDLEQLAVQYPGLRADWAGVDRQALACAPLHDIEGVLGAMVFVWPRPHPMGVAERALITTLAGYAAQAVQRVQTMQRRIHEVEARYADTRAAVLAMQRSLLPDLPVLPGVDLYAHYAPADVELATGGDWYDAIPFGDGRVALVVGDVVGHGPAAAAAMAQLRAVREELLHTDLDVARALRRLNLMAARTAATRAATVCIAVLDSTTGEVSWAAHGHPAPLRVELDGRAGVLPARSTAPLGIRAEEPDVHHVRLAPGELLVLYTDGLVEQPDRDLESGIDDLTRVVTGAHRALSTSDTERST